MPQAFPQLEAGNPVEGDFSNPTLRRDTPEGLEGLAAHMDGLGATLGQMADTAARVQGSHDAAAAGTAAVPDQNQLTAYGSSYNQVARQSLEANQKAALIGHLGEAYAANANDPAGLDKALTAVKAAFKPTGFAEVDNSVDTEFALQRADLMNKAQLGLRQTMTQTQQGAYETAERNAAGTLSQLSAGASYDAAGAAQVTAGVANYARTLSQFGPPTAFSIGGVQIPADPSRTGMLSPAELNARALAATAEAKTQWIGGAQLALPDAAAKARFADDARARYEAGDPIYAGLNGQEAAALFQSLDTQAQKAGVDEKASQAAHAHNFEALKNELQWGGTPDLHQMQAEADASGDAGLSAEARFYAGVAPTVRGVLKTVVGRQLGLIPTPGAHGIPPVVLDRNGNPTAAPGGPVGAPMPGQDPIADQVRGYAAGAGATPAEANTLVKFGLVESGLDPTKENNGSHGLFQFRDGTWATQGGGDIRSVKDQTVNALKLLRANTAGLTGALGRPPTEGEVYLAHQQGVAGAEALLSAPPGASAVAALTPIYERTHPGNGAAVAAQAVTGNGGAPAESAGEFAARWTGRFDAGTGTGLSPPAAPDAWTPPPGTKPGSPAFVAWANTKEGFASDPIKFAAANSLGAVPPMIPQAAFAQDRGEEAGWATAIKGRLALGRTLQGSYGVPLRLFTDAEKDDYKSILAANPTAIVPFASRLTAAIGAAGATAALREIGQDGDAVTAVHVGQLQAWGLPNAAQMAVQGMALKAAGAKTAPSVSYDAGMATEMRSLGPAFKFDPGAMAAGRNVADLMRLADNQRGVDQAPDYYLQSALGMTVSPDGHKFGGVAQVNGAPAILPYWLRQDQAAPVLRGLGLNWSAHGRGPVYANGQPMSGADVGRLQMVETPGGKYQLVDPRSGLAARHADGSQVRLDLDAARPFVDRHFPGATRR